MGGPYKLGRCLTVSAVILGVAAADACAQGRAVRRAVARAVRDSGRPSLLEQMFSPGGAAFRNQSSSVLPFHRHRSLIRPAPITFQSNGTPYDPYAQGSLEDRYFSGPQFNASPLGPPNSSNAVNAYAPATFRMPGGGQSFAPPASFAPSAPGFVSNTPNDTVLPTGGAFNQVPVGGSVASSPSMTEALWIAEKRRRAADTPAQVASYSSVSSPLATVGGAGPAAVSTTIVRSDKRNAMSAGATTPHVRLALREGAKSFQRGDYDASAVAYRRAAELGCTDTRVMLGLGLAELARDRFAEAAAAIRAELVSAPHLDRSGLELVRAYGRPEEFQVHLSRLTEAAATSGSADLQLLLGYLRYFSGDRPGGQEAWRGYLARPDADKAVAGVISRFP